MSLISFIRAKTHKASEITEGRFPVARLPAMTDEKIWKGTGGDVEEVDMPTMLVKAVKVTVTYESPDPTTILSIPAGSIVFAVMVNVTTAFGADADVQGVGDEDDAGGYLDAVRINADTTGWKPTVLTDWRSYLYDATEKYHPKLYLAAKTIQVDLLDATLGSMDVYVVYISLA